METFLAQISPITTDLTATGWFAEVLCGIDDEIGAVWVDLSELLDGEADQVILSGCWICLSTLPYLELGLQYKWDFLDSYNTHSQPFTGLSF